MPNQGVALWENALRKDALCIRARFPRSLQVALAASAQSLAAHVRAVVPATLAFRVGAGLHVHLGRTLGAVRSCTRRDEHILQLVAKPCNRVVHRAGGPD